MKIVIIGSGYVGLVSGVCLAEIGHNVVCIDVDANKVNAINSGISPIYEDGLDQLIRKNIDLKRLSATTNLEEAIIDADVSIIAVGTPFDGKKIDLSYVRQAAIDIGNSIRDFNNYHVICVKSTVVPGTTQDVVGPLLEGASGRMIGLDIGLCMNPEFLAEGSAIKDFMDPDRIVIGASDELAAKVMQQMYAPFNDTDLILTTLSTAEMCKYTANAFLATVISFSNEIANLCSVVGNIDAIDVMKAVHLDRRLSPILPKGRITPGLMSFLYPGTGFGGSCFPKDVKALVSFGSSNGQSLNILEAVLDTNRMQPDITVNLIRKKLGTLNEKRIAVLGLAFKAGTDDVRESPAIHIINALLKDNAFVVAHDPIAISSMKAAFPALCINYCDRLDEAIKDSDAIVLVTSWPEYKTINVKIGDKSIPIIDGRRYLDKTKFENYEGIGLNNS